jgi:hypothetical protein
MSNKPGRLLMTKKKRAAKRSTKAGKRRPSTKRVAAKGRGGAFQSGEFQSGAFQGLPPSASQRKPSPAVQSTVGEVSPPDISSTRTGRTAAANMAGAGGLDGGAFVLPAPVPITPTVYPDSPRGTIIVQHHVTIDIKGVEFREFNRQMEALIGELRKSNEISGEVRDKLIAEVTAGRATLSGPKPDRNMLELLIARPLRYIIKHATSAVIQSLASKALEWLLSMIGAA